MAALKNYFVMSKTGIVVFVLIGGIVGYVFGMDPAGTFSLSHFSVMLFGLYFLSSGSFILNQVQESDIDSKMGRTSQRPLVLKRISAKFAERLAVGFLILGLLLLQVSGEKTAWLGLATVVMYNGFYTMIWKPKWAFGAVPGAIPGAMPIVIGYAAISSEIFTMECVYLFLIMFLWQMPHFWAIAIKFKEDYRRADIPVLPTNRGVPKTIYFIGLYTFAYVALAIAAPMFVETRAAYLVLVVPMAIKLLVEFFRYLFAVTDDRWFQFFIWTNISVLAFLLAPVVDKWQIFAGR